MRHLLVAARPPLSAPPLRVFALLIPLAVVLAVGPMFRPIGIPVLLACLCLMLSVVCFYAACVYAWLAAYDATPDRSAHLIDFLPPGFRHDPALVDAAELAVLKHRARPKLPRPQSAAATVFDVGSTWAVRGLLGVLAVLSFVPLYEALVTAQWGRTVQIAALIGVFATVALGQRPMQQRQLIPDFVQPARAPWRRGLLHRAWAALQAYSAPYGQRVLAWASLAAFAVTIQPHVLAWAGLTSFSWVCASLLVTWWGLVVGLRCVYTRAHRAGVRYAATVGAWLARERHGAPPLPDETLD